MVCELLNIDQSCYFKKCLTWFKKCIKEIKSSGSHGMLCGTSWNVEPKTVLLAENMTLFPTRAKWSNRKGRIHRMWPAVLVVFCYYLWSLHSCHLPAEEWWQLPEVGGKEHGRIYIRENSIHWLHYFWEFRKDHHDPLAAKMLGLALETARIRRQAQLAFEKSCPVPSCSLNILPVC